MSALLPFSPNGHQNIPWTSQWPFNHSTFYLLPSFFPLQFFEHNFFYAPWTEKLLIPFEREWNLALSVLFNGLSGLVFKVVVCFFVFFPFFVSFGFVFQTPLFFFNLKQQTSQVIRSPFHTVSNGTGAILISGGERKFCWGFYFFFWFFFMVCQWFVSHF